MTQPSERNPGSSADVERVSREIAGRLTARGINLSGRERPQELLALEEATERFERAVQSRGGDLMMDEGPRGRTTEPDDPHFVLPKREAHEAVDHYLERLQLATDNVLRHPRKP